MPELPEVETIAREMREAHLVGVKIKQGLVFWPNTISLPKSIESFLNQIKDQTILNISRRGKFLKINLSQDTLWIHFRMTGKFLIQKNPLQYDSHERVRLYLDDERILSFIDQRKFGKWYLTDNPEIIEQNIGVEPLEKEFTLKLFKDLLKNKKRQIKPFLLDQQYIAGIGNIYADEALWEAKIHPSRTINDLKKHEIESLFHAIPLVLIKGVNHTGTSLGSSRANYFSVSGRRGQHQNLLNVFRREGLPCPRCQHIIKKIIVHQRGTHFCPHCQTL